jgi:uncharacterized protein (TIGR00255 family)
MTGFGVAQAAHGASAQLEVEVRSVNGRHLKVMARVSDPLLALLPQLEELVRSRTARGALHLQARLSGSLDGAGAQIDAALLRRFFVTLQAAARDLGAEPPRISEVALLPGVVREDLARDAAQEAWPALEQATCAALDQLEAMRKQEGLGIAQDLRQTCEAILELAKQVEARAPEVVRDQGARLRGRIEQLLSEAQRTLDPGVLARETALLADRSDVSEEVQRLRSHVEQLLSTLGEDGPVGRKLEFLAQELLREANTMASKAHDTSLVQLILQIKLHVERIREQVANVE